MGMTPRKKAYVETYGCQMNISDGELMSGVLASHGYDLVDAPDQADVVLVNTCAIREHAEQRVLGRVAQLNGLKETNPGLLLGVTGCMAQRMGGDLLKKAPFLDLVMGPDGYRGLPEALQAADSGALPSTASHPELVPLTGLSRNKGRGYTVLKLDPAENYEGLELRRTSSVAAWVPIQRGCNHRCTFCIVPFVRGPEKNRDPRAVLAEIRDVAGKGFTEVTLLGQTVNSYRAEGWDFPRLLRAVAGTPGIRRVRFTSPHPNDVTPQLMEVMAGEEAVCEQLHLPLQAGNDRTLKRMLRRHSVGEFLEKVRMIRDAVPAMALSTDVIVAFPGETASEFRDTLSVLREVRFDEAFTYRFSPREGTPATRFPREELIPEEEGRARLDELIQLTRGIQGEINEGEVGRVEEVLVERPGKEVGFMLGRTRRNKVVVFPGVNTEVGSYQTLELTRTTGATFVASRVDPAALAGSK
ncbi:MAG: MiaB/RimO family radical SAM methylthiotransferase [Gemmatimonadales bacterium]|nr:MAG: MiaB/RimO family radical SAM methylthiotransferase [Gemmatimonadales bacterium]